MNDSKKLTTILFGVGAILLMQGMAAVREGLMFWKAKKAVKELSKVGLPLDISILK